MINEIIEISTEMSLLPEIPELVHKVHISQHHISVKIPTTNEVIQRNRFYCVYRTTNMLSYNVNR